MAVEGSIDFKKIVVHSHRDRVESESDICVRLSRDIVNCERELGIDAER